MPKTLTQTILAAFCAILFASSLEGGGVMRNLAARAAMYARLGVSQVDAFIRPSEYANFSTKDDLWNGAVAVDTPFIPQDNFKIEIGARPYNDYSHSGGAGYCNTIFAMTSGSSVTSEPTNMLCLRNWLGIDYNRHNVQLFDNNATTTDFHDIVCDKNGFSIDGVVHQSAASTFSLTGNTSRICLFCVHATGDYFGRAGNASISYFKGYNDGVLECNMIPVLVNGEAYFKDLVSGTLYGKVSGTGTLDYGLIT